MAGKKAEEQKQIDWFTNAFNKKQTNPRARFIKHRLTGTAGYPFDSDPPQGEHGGVMVDVKEGELSFLFP